MYPHDGLIRLASIQTKIKRIYTCRQSSTYARRQARSCTCRGVEIRRCGVEWKWEVVGRHQDGGNSGDHVLTFPKSRPQRCKHSSPPVLGATSKGIVFSSAHFLLHDRNAFAIYLSCWLHRHMRVATQQSRLTPQHQHWHSKFQASSKMPLLLASTCMCAI